MLLGENEYNQDAIARSGGIKGLVSLLSDTKSAVQSNAASALMSLVRHNPANQKAVV